MERDLPTQYTPLGQLKSSWAIVLGAGILGAITAIFIKKKRPEFSVDD
ncbi:MAG: LPXTG cell wall anchor domain-containing protein [Cyclobacteriaceae bacterium]